MLTKKSQFRVLSSNIKRGTAHLKTTDVSEERVTSIFRVEESWRYVPQKCRLNFNGLHSVIFQKIELFITIAVRNSNSTLIYLHNYSENRNASYDLHLLFLRTGVVIVDAVASGFCL
jgi:hypothetical protein